MKNSNLFSVQKNMILAILALTFVHSSNALAKKYVREWNCFASCVVVHSSSLCQIGPVTGHSRLSIAEAYDNTVRKCAQRAGGYRNIHLAKAIQESEYSYYEYSEGWFDQEYFYSSSSSNVGVQDISIGEACVESYVDPDIAPKYLDEDSPMG